MCFCSKQSSLFPFPLVTNRKARWSIITNKQLAQIISNQGSKEAMLAYPPTYISIRAPGFILIAFNRAVQCVESYDLIRN